MVSFLGYASRQLCKVRAFLHDSMSAALFYLGLSALIAAAAYQKQLLPLSSALSIGGAAAAAAAATLWLWGLRRLAEGYRLPASLSPLGEGPSLFGYIDALVSLLTITTHNNHQQQQQQQQQQQKQQHMKGKVCVITGANSGIGRETSLQLAAWGARVALLCRNEKQGLALARSIHRQQQQQQQKQQQEQQQQEQQQQEEEDYDGSTCGSACKDGCIARFIRADLCSLASLREAAAEVKAFCNTNTNTNTNSNSSSNNSSNNSGSSSSIIGGIDVLIHNAGLISTHDDVIEEFRVNRMMATHVVGPYCLTRLLQQQLEAASGRVVFVTSLAQHGAAGSFHPRVALQNAKKQGGGFVSYHSSKLAEMWLAAALQHEFSSNKSNKTHPAAPPPPPPMVLTVHPGVVDTSLPRDLRATSLLFRVLICLTRRTIMKTSKQGAATVLLLAAAPRKNLQDGGYYAEGELGIVDPRANDAKMQQETLEMCQEITHL
ncbi:hypothetical protein ACSSS7_000941 [Eimeria intestinalis]